MSGDGVLLALHVLAGTLAVVFGPVVLVREYRPPHRSTVGLGYLAAVLAVAITAVGLIAESPDSLGWLIPLAASTAGLAVVGRLAPRWRLPSWSRFYAHGQGGSYIALVTALVVVSVESTLAAWLAPTLIGLPLIERRVHRLGREHGEGRAPAVPDPRRGAPARPHRRVGNRSEAWRCG